MTIRTTPDPTPTPGHVTPDDVIDPRDPPAAAAHGDEAADATPLPQRDLVPSVRVVLFVAALLVFLALGYGIPLAFGFRFNHYVTVMIALGLVAAAYIAESLRAGLQAVPPGQYEAARSLGMSHSRAMVTIVIPQAFRIVLPPLTNEVILLTKDSSLVYVLGLAAHEYELTKFGRDGISALDTGMTPILVAGLFCLVITVPLSLLARRFEARSTK